MWIKAKDKEGFCCLHYAVFSRNFQMTKLLEENGADLFQTNNQGLNVMHIAAQADSPLLLVPVS
jgi:ankyrin repeat protein